MRPDGCLEHLGRKDFQTKVRGYRVEVAEIEMALLEVPGINESVVLARANERQEVELVAYVVAESAQVPGLGKLRAFLKEKLPEYMVPTTYVLLEAMPLTPTGKIDRRTLSTLGPTRRELEINFVAPRTIIEKEIAGIWAEVLNLDSVAVHDNFFDLGGHSLAATRVISQVIKHFQVDLPLKSLFESPTVAEMARLITEHRAEKLSEHELQSILKDLESMSDDQAQGLLSEQGETKNEV
jgi:surfactin family lipopeptide synthetase C